MSAAAPPATHRGRSAAALILAGVVLGSLAGLAFAGFETAYVDRITQQGLFRLALERVGARMGIGAVGGATLAGIALVVAGGVRLLLRRASPRGVVASDRAAARLALWLRPLLALGVVLVAIATIAWGGAALWARQRAAGRPNILLVVMDTVRADRLSTFGYARPTAPELDAFARDAVRFPNFFATSSWTLPSHASLFTGTYPAYHGATQEHWQLDRGFPTLAEVLRDAGYRTWAASQNPIVGPVSKLDQGFAEFEEVWRGGKRFEGGAGAHPVNRAFASFLAGADRDRPFLAFVNYMDAHRPYAPPPEYLRRFARGPANPLVAARVGSQHWYELFLDAPISPADAALASDLYDAELAFLSASVGSLLDTLRGDGRYDDTLVIVTADHGENLGDHGLWDHVFSLYGTTLHIPLLVRLPGGARAGTTDPRLGQLVDLWPTILRIAGIQPASLPGQGVDLFGDAPGERREVLGNYAFPRQALAMIGEDVVTTHADRLQPFLRSLRSLRVDGMKLIEGSDGQLELYDLRNDPGETRNLAPSAPEQAATLARRLEAASASVARTEDAAGGAPARARLADDDREREAALRALGYVR